MYITRYYNIVPYNIQLLISFVNGYLPAKMVFQNYFFGGVCPKNTFFRHIKLPDIRWTHIIVLVIPTMQNAKCKMNVSPLATILKIHFRRKYLHFAFVILNFAFVRQHNQSQAGRKHKKGLPRVRESAKLAFTNSAVLSARWVTLTWAKMLIQQCWRWCSSTACRRN